MRFEVELLFALAVSGGRVFKLQIWQTATLSKSEGLAEQIAQ
jgi:hypothetical protein